MATIITPGGGSPQPSEPGKTPQLQVDSDWKAQAQAEKERLAQAEAERAAKQAALKPAAAPGGVASGAAGAGGGAQGEFPAPDFRGLVDMLAMQAMMYMGGMADRSTGRAVFDPEYSRHMIDLLGVLEEKTKGNLAADEAQDLKIVLNELRLRYVELLKMVAAQSAAGGKAGLAGDIAAGGAGASIPGISSRV